MLRTFLSDKMTDWIKDITIGAVSKTELDHDLCHSLYTILVIIGICLLIIYFVNFRKVLEICEAFINRTINSQGSWMDIRFQKIT